MSAPLSEQISECDGCAEDVTWSHLYETVDGAWLCSTCMDDHSSHDAPMRRPVIDVHLPP